MADRNNNNKIILKILEDIQVAFGQVTQNTANKLDQKVLNVTRLVNSYIDEYEDTRYQLEELRAQVTILREEVQESRNHKFFKSERMNTPQKGCTPTPTRGVKREFSMSPPVLQPVPKSAKFVLYQDYSQDGLSEPSQDYF